MVETVIDRKKRIERLGNEQAASYSITIGATSVDIAQPSLRKSIYLRNVSTAGQVIKVCFSNKEVASTTNGYPLNVNDSILDSNSEGYYCWSGKITAIASAAAATLAVCEIPDEERL